ncbi:hypothetical protein HYS31_08415 [Candidatus Woesearchaeota archaeon]|nr:hypothetical protein [Candidatus Woesearchaeota archaeon]
MYNKSQSSVEFAVLASFMLFVVVGFFAIASYKISESKDESNMKVSESIANLVYTEVEIAKSVNDGYTRTFSLPQSVNGIDYSISLVGNREVIVDYLGYEYVKFLNATGSVHKGDNTISNSIGKVYIN